MDIFDFEKGKIRIAATLTVACCLLMVIFPSAALSASREGIALWFSNVLPALLPFFICANFLQNIGAMRHLRSGIFPFVMSVLSGYPMGAKVVGDMNRSGEISCEEAKRLMSFCSTSGPSFIVGAVGAGMLGSGLLGGIIAISHYAGALLNGILYNKMLCSPTAGYRRREGTASGRGKVKGSVHKNPPASSLLLQDALTDAILMSFRSLGIVLAYIVLFMFATDLLQLSGLLQLLESGQMRALAKGILEMTVGCGAVSECAITGSLKCILCSFLLSWGGLSVLGQTMSMLAGTGISVGYIILTKLTHGLFSALMAFVLTLFVL